MHSDNLCRLLKLPVLRSTCPLLCLFWQNHHCALSFLNIRLMLQGYYFSGDGCRRDEDGFYWITGRVDDVINVSGHRIGTAEVESALGLHPHCAEAAVVG
jgi:acyl-coenzyme A synthetase/AMP-(fatty) acid ligase